MATRVSRGRQRIPMKRIEAHDDLYATFSKRRLGLYKKASELSTLCGVDVGVIIFSPTNNPFSFWHPSPESVIMRHTHPYMPLDSHARSAESNTRARIEYLNGRLDGLLDEKERLKDREIQINEAEVTHPTEARWEEINVDGMDEEQVKRWKEWFKDLNSSLKDRLDELEVEASAYSTAFQQENAVEFPSAAAVTVGPGMFNPGPSLEPSTRVMNMPYDQVYSNYYDVPSPTTYGGGGSSQIPDQYRYFPESSRMYNSLGIEAAFNHFSPHAQEQSTAGYGEPSTSRRDNTA